MLDNYVKIYERIIEKAKSIPNKEEEFLWKPKRPEWPVQSQHFTVPKMAKNKKQTEVQLSKVLAFVDCNNKRRYGDGYTVMPVPTTNKQYLSIWGNPMNVSRAIDFMMSIGLLNLYDEHYSVKKKISKQYVYSYDVEQEIITYCNLNNINKWRVSNSSVLVGGEKESLYIESLVNTIDSLAFKLEKVIFYSDLELLKPEGMTNYEFEELLERLLEENYPLLNIFILLADELNEKIDDVNFHNRYTPSFTWNKSNTAVVKMGIRNTNTMCSAMSEETAAEKRSKGEKISVKTREEVLNENGFTSHYDVRSSIPKVTYLLNNHRWLKNDVDMYEWFAKEVERSAGHSLSEFNPYQRKVMKCLYMRAYFDQENVGANTRRAMAGHDDKEWVDEDMNSLVEAIKAVCGKSFDSEIFFHESNIYLLVQKELIARGFKVWQVYDSWYCDNPYNMTEEDFSVMMSAMVEKCALDYDYQMSQGHHFDAPSDWMKKLHSLDEKIAHNKI